MNYKSSGNIAFTTTETTQTTPTATPTATPTPVSNRTKAPLEKRYAFLRKQSESPPPYAERCEYSSTETTKASRASRASNLSEVRTVW